MFHLASSEVRRSHALALQMCSRLCIDRLTARRARKPTCHDHPHELSLEEHRREHHDDNRHAHKRRRQQALFPFAQARTASERAPLGPATRTCDRAYPKSHSRHGYAHPSGCRRNGGVVRRRTKHTPIVTENRARHQNRTPHHIRMASRNLPDSDAQAHPNCRATDNQPHTHTHT